MSSFERPRKCSGTGDSFRILSTMRLLTWGSRSTVSWVSKSRFPSRSPWRNSAAAPSEAEERAPPEEASRTVIVVRYPSPSCVSGVITETAETFSLLFLPFVVLSRLTEIS